jgi:hypothetical protein
MAYTPGLKRKMLVRIRKERKLPLAGEITVNVGDTVAEDTVVARTAIPGNPQVLNVAQRFGIQAGVDRISDYMKKKEGDAVEQGEVIAQSSIFGFFKKTVESPLNGYIESVSDMTGTVILREPNVPVELKAFIPGTVTETLTGEGCVIECPGAFIQGIFGIGGEANGAIKIVSETPGVAATGEMVGPDCKGKILVTRGSTKMTALRKAVEVGAHGFVSACIDEKEMAEFMGYEIGVAVTGDEDVGLTMIITEGFGEAMNMSENTFQILKKYEGRPAAINGATQIRAGVLRPEVIVPRTEEESSSLSDYDVESTDVLSVGLAPGLLLRVIREPYFGALGHVLELPPDLYIVETGSEVRVLKARLEDGREVIVPRANVEIISE